MFCYAFSVYVALLSWGLYTLDEVISIAINYRSAISEDWKGSYPVLRTKEYTQ